MKRSLTLLAVTMVTATSVGCNCCPCLRNICPVGACAPTAYAPAPTYAAVPACPAPAPVYAAAPPMYAAPQQYTVPQYATPQYAMPAQPVYSDAGCGSSYAAAAPYPCAATAMPCEASCGTSYTVADPGCGYSDVGYGMPSQQVIVDPSPAP